MAPVLTPRTLNIPPLAMMRKKLVHVVVNMPIDGYPKHQDTAQIALVSKTCLANICNRSYRDEEKNKFTPCAFVFLYRRHLRLRALDWLWVFCGPMLFRGPSLLECYILAALVLV